MVQAEKSLGVFKKIELPLTKKDDVRSSSFHPTDPAVLACGMFSGEVVIFKGPNHSAPLATWKIERELRCGSSVLSLEWNIDGTKVAAGSDDGAVIVWCYPGDGKQEFQRQGRSNFPLIVWNPFNRDVLASYNNAMDTNNNVLICNSATSHTIKFNWICNTASWISPNQLACGFNDGTFEIHEIGSQQSKSRMVQKIRQDHDNGPSFLYFSLLGFGKLQCNVMSIAWNKELNLLASGGTNERVKIWSLGNNDPIRVLEVDSICNCLVWNSSGNGAKEETLIACGVQKGFVVIWYPFEPQNQTRKLEGHSFQIHQLLFSPDGCYLASTDYSKKLIVWSSKSWKSIYILPSSQFMYPYMMTWDATSCKLGISERTGQKKFKVIEYAVTGGRCASCEKTSENLKVCARCHSIFYCSKECQRSHWPQHKSVCSK